MCSADQPCIGCSAAAPEESYIFDTDGILVGPVIKPPPVLALRPCSLSTLNGSWLIQLEDEPGIIRTAVRGLMRIEVGSASLRISGDVYAVRRRFPPVPVPFPFTPVGPGTDTAPAAPTYPSFPPAQYSWYFRSTGVTYSGGELHFDLVRHLWDRTSQQFTSTDTGVMTLTCRRSLLVPAGTPASMTGFLRVGGRTWKVTATKTSDFYRGCSVEVDVMTSRTWPESATTGLGVMTDFRQVYASAGWDVTVSVDELDVPADASLTVAELESLITGHRGAGSGERWRLWLLVGSAQGGLFGLMFDDDTVPREGAVGFADATLTADPRIAPSAQNQALNNVPAAFLRTMVHEAGHAFNLFHPKHDIHNPPIGVEIMNQTGDVIGFATSSQTYPGNASFAFAPHDRDSLIHSPDPQVRPGWKNFGWGHGDLSVGLPTPADGVGFAVADDSEGIEVRLVVPTQVYVGEYVIAALTLTNTGSAPRAVTARLNLAEGDVRLLRVGPTGHSEAIRDVVVACGPRPMTELAPGSSVTAYLQIFYTSVGVTFDNPGRHQVVAEVEVDAFTTGRSAPVTLDVRPASTTTELDIAGATLVPDVGRAIAIGDFGAHDDARALLTGVAEQHSDSDTGAACALVMVNALGGRHVNYRTGFTRDAEPDDAAHFLDLAVKGRSAERLLELAVTVASPVEKSAPVVADTLARVKRTRKAKVDVDRASMIATGFGGEQTD